MGLWIEEEVVNASEQYRIGDNFYETDFTTTGDLYRFCLKEFGSCQGKVYIDQGNQPVQVGWIFRKRQKYEDSNDTYLHDTWVTVHDQPATVRKTLHYHKFSRSKLCLA